VPIKSLSREIYSENSVPRGSIGFTDSAMRLELFETEMGV